MLSSRNATQLSFSLLPCSSGLVILAAADTVLFSAGFAPGLTGYCGLGAMLAFADGLSGFKLPTLVLLGMGFLALGFSCVGSQMLCWVWRASLFVELSFGFLPGSPGGRVLPVLFGAGLASAAVGEGRVGAAPALAGFPGSLAVLATALPVVFLSLGRLIPGPVVFPTLFGRLPGPQPPAVFIRWGIFSRG